MSSQSEGVEEGLLHKRFVADLVEFLTPDPTEGTADDAD